MLARLWPELAAEPETTTPPDSFLDHCFTSATAIRNSRREQGIDEAIENMLQGHTPGLSFPDQVLHLSECVSQESSGSGDPKHLQVVSAGGQRASGQVSDEDTDQQAINEP